MAHAFASLTMAALVAVVGIGQLSGHDIDEPFAAVLQRIIRASRENFRPVEGARIDLHPANQSYFQARVDLPGTTECRIDERPKLVYSCQWKSPQPKSSGACDKLLSEVEIALGAEWSRTDSPQTHARKTTFRSSGRYRGTEITVTPPTPSSQACTIAVTILKAAEG